MPNLVSNLIGVFYQQRSYHEEGEKTTITGSDDSRNSW